MVSDSSDLGVISVSLCPIFLKRIIGKELPVDQEGNKPFWFTIESYASIVASIKLR